MDLDLDVTGDTDKPSRSFLRERFWREDQESLSFIIKMSTWILIIQRQCKQRPLIGSQMWNVGSFSIVINIVKGRYNFGDIYTWCKLTGPQRFGEKKTSAKTYIYFNPL